MPAGEARVLELADATAALIREEIRRARGNEVCFAARVGDDGRITDAWVVARGHDSAVLAASRDVAFGAILVHNHPSGDLTPSDADLRIAAELHAQGIGLGIVDNDARELYVVVEPGRIQPLELLDEQEVARILAPGGPVSEAHAQYEDRPTQRDMAREVARVYNSGGIALAEAGTGTGKSIAYLVPAILWSVANRERSIVSTNTINLQEQLVTKDLPFLRRSLGLPFRFALVKGRNNYISIRRARLAAMTAGSLLEEARQREIDAILEWMKQTREGSLQDLPFQPSEEVWDEVVSDSDVCLRARCPHFEECFYQRARRDAAGANVLVVNHHVLFSDIALRRAQNNYTAPAVLPPYRRLILDEAHNLEDAATSHLGVSLTRRSLFRLLGRLERRGRGLLPAVASRLKAGPADLLQEEAVRFIDDALSPVVERAREIAADFFAQLESLCRSRPEGVVRLHDDFTGEPEWIEGPQPALENLLVVLDELARGVARLRDRILVDERWAESMREQIVEMQGIEARLLDTAAGLRTALQPGGDSVRLVRWLELRSVSSHEPNLAIRAAPVELADALRESLFEPVDTVVLTSATLTTRDGFRFIRSRLGIDSGLRVTESTHRSPFDFESRTMVGVVTDSPDQHEDGRDPRIADMTSTVTEDLARLTDGGLFVLFTSWRALRAVAAELRRRGAEGRWPLFVQGESPRARLLARFTESGRGVLLGVASFWEGVDVPGEPLRGLIIAKLPFKVPTEPITAARIEAIEANGGNSFAEYMLPLAALRLKQGFGRLIRTRNDRGAVVILDRRIRERGYGRYLLHSLAPTPVVSAPWHELREHLRALYLRTDQPAVHPFPAVETGTGTSIQPAAPHEP